MEYGVLAVITDSGWLPGMENIKKNIFTQWQKEKVNLKLEFDFSKHS
ncbi:MAG TPA: hypothetical protein VJJ25_02740 [Nitrosopumilaceae archaeon]|nr:hypothetical protein [Nitrosopumilaceae archaeon]